MRSRGMYDGVPHVHCIPWLMTGVTDPARYGIDYPIDNPTDTRPMGCPMVYPMKWFIYPNVVMEYPTRFPMGQSMGSQ